MCGLYVKMPATEDEWRIIAANFMHKWQFPNCIGALDGKHVIMTSPIKSGSLYFNYKGTISMVLMAMVDADLKFTYIDIGGYGRNSDGVHFKNQALGKLLLLGNCIFQQMPFWQMPQNLAHCPTQ